MSARALKVPTTAVPLPRDLVDRLDHEAARRLIGRQGLLALIVEVALGVLTEAPTTDELLVAAFSRIDTRDRTGFVSGPTIEPAPDPVPTRDRTERVGWSTIATGPGDYTPKDGEG